MSYWQILEHYRTSEPMKIGKTLWRMHIRKLALPGGPALCTVMEWQDKYGDWIAADQWPSYDGNDTYDGLPRTLAKLYEREQPYVDRFIYGREPRQAAMEF